MTQDLKTSSNRIVLISDIHYHLHQAFSKDGGRSRLADIVNVMRQCHDYCVSNNIKDLFILGDVFEKRGVIDSIVYNAFADDMKTFIASGIKVTILVGNHDQDLISNNTWDNSLSPINKFSDNLVIVSKPQVFTVGGKSILCLPYIHEHNLVQELINKSYTDYAFIHAGIYGAKLIDSDYKVKSGVDLSKVRSIPIFSGHYHTPQELGTAVYVGSPLHHSFNDSGQQKGFIDLDLSTGEWFRVPTKYPNFIKVTLDKPDDVYNLAGQDYFRISLVDNVLLQKHFTHLQTQTKAYEVVYQTKSAVLVKDDKFDTEFQGLKKFILNEFDSDHAMLYREAKKYLC